MLHPINLMIGGLFVAFIALDSLFPARKFPQPHFWKVKGVVSAIAYIALATYSPYLWASWLTGPLLLDVSHLPIWAQCLLGYAAIQFVAYWWHRAMHKSDTLWRIFHQMHHSVERMDAWGSLYHHPLDVVGFTFMGSFALTMLIGITADAAAIVGVFGAGVVFFTHCNIKTPRWIGWLIERPEGHGVHHERGRHASNYAELVIWDQLFGTWRNPKTWTGEAGFYDGASNKIWSLLIGRKIA
ncbi:MAG: sterol desaturase family protein [Pseudomonadota bacterium]